ncbi:MAG: tetratricopeptide repeat protein, partial [Chloroflexota bacterium]|nr:tetratricopeptide repeat protein [Chloroflexota bacterium]
YWESRGPWKEGCDVIDAILDARALPSSALVGDLLHRSGNLHGWLDQRDVAYTRYQQALSIRRLGSDPDRTARTLYNLGLMAERPEDAVEYLDEALAIRLEHGLGYETALRWAIAAALWRMDDLPGAREQMDLALRVARRKGDHAFVFDVLEGMAELARLEGHYDEAERLYRDAEEEAGSFGFADDALIVAGGLARCATRAGRFAEAESRLADAAARVPRTEEWAARSAVMNSLLGALADLECAKGNVLVAAQAWGAQDVAIRNEPNSDSPAHRRERQHAVERAREHAPGTAFDAAWVAGASHPPLELPTVLCELLQLPAPQD